MSTPDRFQMNLIINANEDYLHTSPETLLDQCVYLIEYSGLRDGDHNQERLNRVQQTHEHNMGFASEPTNPAVDIYTYISPYTGHPCYLFDCDSYLYLIEGNGEDTFAAPVPAAAEPRYIGPGVRKQYQVADSLDCRTIARQWGHLHHPHPQGDPIQAELVDTACEENMFIYTWQDKVTKDLFQETVEHGVNGAVRSRAWEMLRPVTVPTNPAIIFKPVE